MHLCMGAYGEHSSRLRNFEGFMLVTNLEETKEAKCKLEINIGIILIYLFFEIDYNSMCL